VITAAGEHASLVRRPLILTPSSDYIYGKTRRVITPKILQTTIEHPKTPPKYDWKTSEMALTQGPKFTVNAEFAPFFSMGIGLGKAPQNGRTTICSALKYSKTP
jgi:hypothetical protein